MVSMSHHYRNLSHAGKDEATAQPVVDDVLEDMQLASFDTGYQAGWDDALKAHEQDASQAASGIAQNLQDMSFTHQEAYLKLSTAMKPLLSLIVDKLLPQVAHQVVGIHILDQLSDLMDSHADTALEIAVCPDNLDDLQAILADIVRIPFTLSPDPTLGKGQAYLRIGTSEQEINLEAVLSGISEALEAFFEQTKEEISDG